MKRLCVFYKYADEHLGKRIEWIVCRMCQKRLRKGEKDKQRLRATVLERAA